MLSCVAVVETQAGRRSEDGQLGLEQKGLKRRMASAQMREAFDKSERCLDGASLGAFLE